MNETTLKEGLSTQILGQDITFFDQTDSTNLQAKQWCDRGLCHEGHAFVAQRQTQGKGTDGNSWESGQDNLSLSLVFDYDEKITTLFPLYPAVALAKALRDKHHIEAHVKWPNDVLVGQKKIAGILCEGVPKSYMIVGIGININQVDFPEKLDEIATSVQIEKGTVTRPEDIFADFLSEYEQLLYSNTDIRQEWLNHTKMVGKRITAKQDGNQIKATITGISNEGFLQVENSQGETETWMARRGLDISTQY